MDRWKEVHHSPSMKQIADKTTGNYSRHLISPGHKLVGIRTPIQHVGFSLESLLTLLPPQQHTQLQKGKANARILSTGPPPTLEP